MAGKRDAARIAGAQHVVRAAERIQARNEVGALLAIAEALLALYWQREALEDDDGG